MRKLVMRRIARGEKNRFPGICQGSGSFHGNIDGSGFFGLHTGSLEPLCQIAPFLAHREHQPGP